MSSDSNSSRLDAAGISHYSVPVVQMVSITKRFPGIVANRDVSLSVQSGAFHAVIGENGAGKSTLLNVLFGRYRPDSGRVMVRGIDVTDKLRGPADAIGLGIGLVSQHYSLIPALTVLENVVLGSEPYFAGGILNLKQAKDRIDQLAESLGLAGLDLHERAEQLSIAAGQKVEILKALYRNAGILLLDEPTAALAPQEAESLFSLLHALQQQGSTIVFVTHKLAEVMAHSDRVSVLRTGRNAGDFPTKDTTAQELLTRMIGPRVEANAADTLPLGAPPAGGLTPDAPQEALLRIAGVSVRGPRGGTAVNNVSLELFPGEILGIAGVDGSGQKELSEAVVGLIPIKSGEMTLTRGADGALQSLAGHGVRQRQKMGIAYIPEDRHRSAIILDFSIAENVLLGHEADSVWGGGVMLSNRKIKARADQFIRSYDVRVGERDSSAAARALSGGNQQKVVIARALESDPRLLIACQPTRGLDTGATQFVYSALRTAKARGLGILLFSLDLDEVLLLSDRIAVMFNGAVAGVLTREEATAQKVGELMTGSQRVGKERRA